MNIKMGLLGIVLLLGGCATPVRVPSDAQLIWYGRLDQSGNIPLPSARGQVYFVDDASGRVISVQTIGKSGTKPAVDPTILPLHNAYRIYFVKDATTAPATRPASRPGRGHSNGATP